jgi:hypothetical protein
MFFLFSLGIIFFSIGAALANFGFAQRKKTKTAEAWPIVNGVIESSRLIPGAPNKRGDGYTYSDNYYTPAVEYTYEISGQTYRGSHINAGKNMSYDRSTAQGIVILYHPGTAVTVHYNPADPSQAVLETKSRGGKAFLFFGAVFAVLGLLSCSVVIALVVIARL